MESELCKIHNRIRQTQASVKLVSMICYFYVKRVSRKKDCEIVKDDEKGRLCRLFQYSSIFQNSPPTVNRRKEKRKTVFGPPTIRTFNKKLRLLKNQCNEIFRFRARICKRLWNRIRNRIRGIDSARLCSLAGRYDK
jgi:hypothetical protein